MNKLKSVACCVIIFPFLLLFQSCAVSVARLKVPSPVTENRPGIVNKIRQPEGGRCAVVSRVIDARGGLSAGRSSNIIGKKTLGASCSGFTAGNMLVIFPTRVPKQGSGGTILIDNYTTAADLIKDRVEHSIRLSGHCVESSESAGAIPITVFFDTLFVSSYHHNGGLKVFCYISATIRGPLYAEPFNISVSANKWFLFMNNKRYLEVLNEGLEEFEKQCVDNFPLLLSDNHEVSIIK